MLGSKVAMRTQFSAHNVEDSISGARIEYLRAISAPRGIPIHAVPTMTTAGNNERILLLLPIKNADPIAMPWNLLSDELKSAPGGLQSAMCAWACESMQEVSPSTAALR